MSNVAETCDEKLRKNHWQTFVCEVKYMLFKKGGDWVLLTFKIEITKCNEEQKNIINELSWHVEKVYNSLLYEIREKKRNIDLTKSLNILSSRIYKEYRAKNWHSKYLHSHTLQQTILNVIQDYKSYVVLSKMYKKEGNNLKGKPRLPRYKHNNDTKEIVFTKCAVRINNNEIKLSLSKEMQNKFQVKSLNFLISNKLKNLVDLSRIKMIKIICVKGKITMYIIYEREAQVLPEDYTNICAIDLGLNNIVSMTLEVRVSNIVAQNLYKKYGFKLAGIRKEYYSDNKEDAMIMWKR